MQELSDICQVKSVLGTNNSQTNYNGVLMFFGGAQLEHAGAYAACM